MAGDEFAVEFRVAEEDLADEAEAWFLGHADDVSRSTDLQFLPLVPIVIAGLLTLAGLAQLILWIRAKTRCRVIIDVRFQKIRKTVDCSERDGRVIFVVKGDEKVHVHEAPAPFNFNEVLGAAISGGAEAVMGAALAAGLRAEREPTVL